MIRTMEGHPYVANEPGGAGRFFTGQANYDTGRLPMNFAFFTPEIIRRCTRRVSVPDQDTFERIVWDIAHEYAVEQTDRSSSIQ